MNSNGLLICTFTIKDSLSKSTRIALNDPIRYNIESQDYYLKNVGELFEKFSEKYKNKIDDTDYKKIFLIKEESFVTHSKGMYSAFSFLISSGAYGYKNTIKNRFADDQLINCTRDDAILKDFNCMVYVPTDIGVEKIYKGIIIFQSIGNYGVKTITTKHLKRFCKSLGLSIELSTVSISEFLEKIIEGNDLKKMTMIRNEISNDISDNLLITSGREERVFIKPKVNIDMLRNLFNKKDKGCFVEFDGAIFTDMTFTFKIGKRVRTIRLGALDSISMVEDVPENVYNDETDKDSVLLEYMVLTANDYREKIIFTEMEI